jgi:outer membrane protein assembly factor BamB
MKRRRIWAAGFLLALGLWLLAVPAHAVIMVLTPLSDILKGQQYICVAKVEMLDPERPLIKLTVTEDLKGKLPFRRLSVLLKGDAEAKKHGQVKQMLKRLAPDLPLVLFADQRGKQLTVYAYTNGTWFQMTGQAVAVKADAVVLGFTHCEPYLRRTFKGTTAELRQVIEDGLSGKKAPPRPNAKEPPGLGPEVKAEKESSLKAARFSDLCFGTSEFSPPPPAIAVIPTIGVGAPLAVLALLFPSLFGGAALLLRRWGAFFAVFSINSLICLFYMLLGAQLLSWTGGWATPKILWWLMTFVALLGLAWAWRRHLTFQRESGPEAPPRTELLVLGILSLSFLAVTGVYWWLGSGLDVDLTWKLLLALTVGLCAAALYRLYRGLRFGLDNMAPGLPTEGLILLVILGASVLLTPAAYAVASDGDSVSSELEPDKKPAKFVNGDGVYFQKAQGMVVSAPLIIGDKIYVSVAHKAGIPTFGTVYCLDRKTRKELWAFDDGGSMKQIFSSPVVADGRLYIGEGFHNDADCKVYCLSADTGEKLWEYQTGSQTESTPCVAGGKVFIGAGNDGVLALDARTGKRLWQFQNPSGKSLLRIGAGPAVAGNRLYVGSGVDRNSPDDPGETAVFCLNTETGKPVWKIPTKLPAWATPVVADGQVIFALGNGDIVSDDPHPAGAVLCLDARDGREFWRVALPNGVLERPAVDAASVYAGCRDGHCYCLNRYTGETRWKKDLGSPVLASPALDPGPDGCRSLSVFVVAKAGRVACLDPATGKEHWRYRDIEKTGNAHLSSAPTVLVSAEEGGRRRRLYFGVALHEMTQPGLYRLEDLLPR